VVLEVACWNRPAMLLKLNTPICYLNLNLPKFVLKSKLKLVERKLKKHNNTKCAKGQVDEDENNMKLNVYFI
jgi:hypothetical protein